MLLHRKGLGLEFPGERVHLRKSKPPRKTLGKWTFLSLAFNRVHPNCTLLIFWRNGENFDCVNRFVGHGQKRPKDKCTRGLALVVQTMVLLCFQCLRPKKDRLQTLFRMFFLALIFQDYRFTVFSVNSSLGTQVLRCFLSTCP